MMDLKLTRLVKQLRTMANNVEGCARSGGDMTSMIDVRDGFDAPLWVTAESLHFMLNTAPDDRLVEMAESVDDHPQPKGGA